MKKLLLLLIIPFLSFGQCEDESACNYGMTAEDFIDGAFADDCEYIGDYCFLRELFMPEIGGWCAGQNISYAKWNENCECAETEHEFCPDGSEDCTIVYDGGAKLIPVMIPDSIYCGDYGMPGALYAMCVEPGDSCLFRYWNLPYGVVSTDFPYWSMFPTSILDEDFDNFPLDWLMVSHFNSVINDECECECVPGEYFYYQWDLSGVSDTIINYYDCSDEVDLNELPNTKILITTVDILGRETNNNEGFQLQIYDDGSVEKKYLIK